MPTFPPRYPDVNGIRTSYCSIELVIQLIQLKGVKSINWRDPTTIPKIWGTSATPIGRTRGQNDPDGDIEFYQQEFDFMLPVLSRAGIFGFSETSNVIQVSYAELLSPEATVSRTLIGARVHSPESTNQEGTDATAIKCGLSLMGVVWGKGFQSLRHRPF